MKNEIYDGMRIEKNGREYRINAERDDYAGKPWEEYDGHGIVSEWTTRDKKPGERILASDRLAHRYYDVQATIEKANAERWGLADYLVAALSLKLGRSPTRREIITAAVDRDYEYLRGWCNDDWQWCFVTVTDIACSDYVASVGGVESLQESLKYTVDELITECSELRDIAIFDARRSYHIINKSAVDLIREIKAAGKSFSPAICSTLRDRLSTIMSERSTYHSIIAG